MTHDDHGTAAEPTQGGALKHPETPDVEAVQEHKHEGDGPFGADMQNLLGGTRSTDTDHDASPYATGTNAQTGASMSPNDPRSSFARRGNGTDAQREGAHQGTPAREALLPDAITEPVPDPALQDENPDIRWDKR